MRPPTHQSNVNTGIVKLSRGGREVTFPHCFRSDILSAVTLSGFAGECRDDWPAAPGVAKDRHGWRYFGAGLSRSAPQEGRIFSCLRAIVTRPFRRCQRRRSGLPCPSNHGKFLFLLLMLHGHARHRIRQQTCAGCREDQSRAGSSACQIGSGRCCQRLRWPSRRWWAYANDGHACPAPKASRDGDPAICFCGKEVVSRTVCRAGCLLACKPSSVAGPLPRPPGRKSTATQKAPQGVRGTSPRTWPHLAAVPRSCGM